MLRCGAGENQRHVLPKRDQETCESRQNERWLNQMDIIEIDLNPKRSSRGAATLLISAQLND